LQNTAADKEIEPPYIIREGHCKSVTEVRHLGR